MPLLRTQRLADVGITESNSETILEDAKFVISYERATGGAIRVSGSFKCCSKMDNKSMA